MLLLTGGRLFSLPGAWMLLLIPEEVLVLGLLLAWCLGRVDGLQGVGVVAGVPHLGGDGHGGGGEVLYLFQMEAEPACDGGELGHVLFVAAGV